MKVKIEVVSQTGKCSAKHKVGDSWILEHTTVDGICFSAFCSLISWIQMQRFDGKTNWDIDVACPDYENPVVFRITKVEEA